MNVPAKEDQSATGVCRVEDCEGHYEKRRILHCLETPERGRVCIDNVPALVCPVCGETWFELKTIQRLERLLASDQKPAGQLDVYDFEQGEAAQAVS